MPRNGTGTYTLPYNWNDDLANGITIQAGRMMGQQDDVATALTDSIAKDGQTIFTGNQSMGNNKITNLGNSTAAQDAIPTAQVQNNSLFNLGTSLGVADAYTAAAVPAITAYETTMSFRLKIHATNATTTPTLQLNGIGAPALDAVIKKIDTGGVEVAVAVGDLDLGGIYDFQRNTANNAWILMNENTTVAPATTAIFGKTLLPLPIKLTNNAVDANNNMDFGAGVFQFDDGSGMSTFAALTKELDGTWVAGTNQGGLDTGAKAADTWYYMYAIYNPTTGAADALFTATYGAPTMPAGFTKKAYVGALLTGAAGNILPGNFQYRRDGSYRFIFNDRITDYTTSTPPSTSTAVAITAPIFGDAILNVTYLDNDGASSYVILNEESQTDIVPSYDTATVVSNSSYYSKNADFTINVGANQRIFVRSSDAGATYFILMACGFIDNNY